MSERQQPIVLEDQEASDRHARSIAPMRSRGHKKPSNRSSRSSAKRSKRTKSAPGGIHQRRNKRSSW
ncbi:hypothetical protein [Aeoliella sp.]|uniref:hypothetical protein n=1 Tax=Aeoliella sp. TaxID=2795800 RepID=UPI003CCBB4CB